MLIDRILKPEDFEGKNIKALPDNPSQAGITAAQLKDFFDRVGEKILAAVINAIIGDLTGGEGASNIGAVGGISVQAALDEANELILQKAGIDNVLTKDNALPYSPQAPYNPATKLFVEQSMSASGQGSAVVVIPQGEDIPIPERTPNTYYYKITDTQSGGGGFPSEVKVSPNMGIKIEKSQKQSKSGINFE